MRNRAGMTPGLPRAASALAFAAMALSTACTPSAPEPLEPGEDMWVHFGDVATIQLAMARGELDRARRAAERVEESRDIPGVPEGWDEDVEQLRRYAEAIRSARSFSVAAEAAAYMVASCGDCHVSHDVGPIFGDVPAPPEVGEVDHMVEHVWAADRLWEGLMIPSDQRWMAGARVLADHAVPMDLLIQGTSPLGVQLKALGLEALGDGTLDQRAGRYARILNTCADCHTRSNREDWSADGAR